MKSRLISIVGVICALLVWEGCSIAFGNPRTFPGAIRAGNFSIEILSNGFGKDLLATIARSLASWLVGLILAYPFGLVLGSFPLVHAALRPLTAFVRAMPAFLLIAIPIAIGCGGEISRISVTATAVAAILIDQCADGVGRTNTARSETMFSLGGGWWFRLRFQLAWEVFGNVIAPAARSTLGLAFIVIIVNESLVIPDHGVGARILNYIGSNDLGPSTGFLLLVGTVGILLNELIVLIMRRLVFWRE